MIIRSSTATSQGGRDKQEDALLAVDLLKLYVVADGLGGHAAGELASAMATDPQFWVPNIQKLNEWDWEQGVDRSFQVKKFLEQAVLLLHKQIQEASGEAEGRWRGMETTITVLLIFRGFAYIAHVGDSRAYLYRRPLFQQLTEDHTMERQFLKHGRQLKGPNRYALFQSLGQGGTPEVQLIMQQVCPGDQYLLCTDGLHGRLSDRAMEDCLTIASQRPPSDDENVADDLVTLALYAADQVGESARQDNTTTIVVHVHANT